MSKWSPSMFPSLQNGHIFLHLILGSIVSNETILKIFGDVSFLLIEMHYHYRFKKKLNGLSSETYETFKIYHLKCFKDYWSHTKSTFSLIKLSQLFPYSIDFPFFFFFFLKAIFVYVPTDFKSVKWFWMPW